MKGQLCTVSCFPTTVATRTFHSSLHLFVLGLCRSILALRRLACTHDAIKIKLTYNANDLQGDSDKPVS